MRYFRLIIPALLLAAAHAEELTLEAKPFFIAHNLTATALPSQSSPVRIDPEAWPTFKIISIANHGSIVKKDQALVVFETEEFEKKLADTRQAIAAETLALAAAELALATLQKTVPENLARLKRDAEEAAEKLGYFTATSRKISEEKADYDLRRTEQMVASYEEELKQLRQMYEADDITEETEEIILEKQKFAVESAKFSLKSEILDHKRIKELTIPREGVELQEKSDDAALVLETGSKELPRSIEQKKVEVAGLKTSLARNQKLLADLESDRKFFEIKAPADGTFYFGSIEEGKWTTGDLIKVLVPGGSAPAEKAFGTFIPSNTSVIIQAFLNQATAQALAPGAKGIATLKGRTDTPIPVTLESLSSTPNPDKAYPAVFIAEWPDGKPAITGQSLSIDLVSYTSPNAIVVPTKALTFGPVGWTAEVKLADGKTERRPVTRGKSSEDKTEITTGLEAGQVVIVP